MGKERIEAKTVLWAAGVASSPLGRALGAPLDRAGRVLVEPDLSVPGHPEIFVIGDLAAVPGVPGIAPAAKQMGRHVAFNIVASLKNEKTKPFRYRDYGQLATIGRNAAVAELGRVKLSGLPGLAGVAGRAHLLPHQLPQPAGRDARLGVGVLDLSPLRQNRHQTDYLTSITPPSSRVQAADVVVLACLLDGQRRLCPAGTPVRGPFATVIWCGVSSVLRKLSGLPADALMVAGMKAKLAILTSVLTPFAVVPAFAWLGKVLFSLASEMTKSCLACGRWQVKQALLLAFAFGLGWPSAVNAAYSHSPLRGQSAG
jgi:hypothetical protein